jgi:hypothetical protein
MYETGNLEFSIANGVKDGRFSPTSAVGLFEASETTKCGLVFHPTVIAADD